MKHQDWHQEAPERTEQEKKDRIVRLGSIMVRKSAGCPIARSPKADR